MKIDLATIILNYNNFDDTISLVNQLIYDGKSLKIVVVDNMSTDDSRSKLENFFSDFEILKISSFIYKTKNIELVEYKCGLVYIKSDINGGFAYGNNLGLYFSMNQTNCSHFLVLNNDVKITDGFIEGIFLFSKANSKFSLFGSIMLLDREGKHNTLQGVGGKFNSFTGRSKHIGLYEKLGENHMDYDVSSLDYPIGACLLFPRKTIEDIGYLNEEYFLYFEELDYVYQMRKNKMEFTIYKDKPLFHKCGATIEQDKDESGLSSTSTFYLSRSRDIFMSKYHPYKWYIYKFLECVLKMKNLVRNIGGKC
ncbi:glycosyltransferase family 2 protein [Vibrio cyclitrophicus]